MVNLKSAVSLALVLSALSQTGCLASEKEDMKAAVASYNSKSYKQAITKLESVLRTNSKNELARYYLALSLQAVGRIGDAKREYLWNYENASNKDLRYKSWQGANGLARMKVKAASSSVPSSATNGASLAEIPVSSTPYKAQVGEAPSSSGGFTRGCFKH